VIGSIGHLCCDATGLRRSAAARSTIGEHRITAAG